MDNVRMPVEIEVERPFPVKLVLGDLDNSELVLV